MLALYKFVHELYIGLLPVQNDHLDGLDDIIGSAFKEMNVRQIIAASDSVFDEMCNELTRNGSD